MGFQGQKDHYMESATYVEERHWKGKEYAKVVITDYLSIQKK